ncbi:Retrovirus-related Pol polyprotein from type-2 retrotransposable element R2DM, partial [Nosema granulosis]
MPTRGSDFRPITCMSNLYKLTTKCITKVMQILVEERGLLAENQLGTVRLVQGAKEQAMLNIAVNKEYKNSLKTMWIDVKKAYDSVDHAYLVACIERLNLPQWIGEFLKSTIKKWHIEIRAGSEMILEKKIERGILQGDSLSPLLFVLCMDPLSRKLNSKYPKVGVQTDNQSFVTNHLLFIDDLKLLAENEDNLKAMKEETKEFFSA